MDALSPQSIDRFFSGSGRKRGFSTSPLSRLHPRLVKENSLDWKFDAGTGG
jgi:hypothetical protein